MKKFITRLNALVLAALLVATAAHAQSSVGTVEGTVTDEQGAVLPGAVATACRRRPRTTKVSSGLSVWRLESTC